MILLGTEWYQKNLVSSPITQFIKYFKLVLSLLGRFFLIFFNSFSNYFFCLKPWSKIHKEHLHQVLYWSNWSPRKCWNAKVFFLFSIKWTICCLILFSVVSLFGHHRSESGSSLRSEDFFSAMASQDQLQDHVGGTVSEIKHLRYNLSFILNWFVYHLYDPEHFY